MVAIVRRTLLAGVALSLWVAAPAAAQNFTVLVSSSGSHSVVRFDQEGNFLNHFVYPGSGSLVVPLKLVFGPDGQVYLSNRDGERVNRYTADGGFVGTFAIGGGLNNPHGLAFGSDGNLYVAGEVSNAVHKYDGATGAFLGSFVTGLDLPVDLEFTAAGDLVVADRTTIRRYDSSGTLIGTIPFYEARGDWDDDDHDRR